MRLNRLFSVAMLSMLFGGSAWAQQPYSGCWHPCPKIPYDSTIQETLPEPHRQQPPRPRSAWHNRTFADNTFGIMLDTILLLLSSSLPPFMVILRAKIRFYFGTAEFRMGYFRKEPRKASIFVKCSLSSPSPCPR